ncbi:MAG: TIGR02996 domain-containing protein [Myxococcota bacterium]|nr:TIGR02996 domain-containing protein [Myxococcota bacterium]
MARYEYDGKFWTIVRSVSVVTITQGKLGNKGRTSTLHHATPAEAIARHDALVVEKQREGYRLAETATTSAPADAGTEPPTSDDAHGAALEAAIADDPDDAQAYAVYGDWLQRRGDPRGELIALQLAAAAEAARPGAKPAKSPRSATTIAVGKHLAKHAPRLLGDLARLVRDLRDPAAPPLIWGNGFIRRVELASEAGRPLADAVAEILAHPSGRFVVELALRATAPTDAAEVVAKLAHRAPASLRELDLFARVPLKTLDRLWPRVARLRRLTVTAPNFKLGDLELPALERARFLAGSMSSEAIRSIADAPWPVLERLEIRFCGRYGSSKADFHDLRTLLQRDDLPKLTHLRLRGAPFAGAITRTLIDAPIGDQLQVLDLANGNVSPADLQHLARHAGAFSSLKEIWLHFDHLTQAMQPALAGVAKHVLSDARAPVDMLDEDLRDDRPGEANPDDDRYDGIRE